MKYKLKNNIEVEALERVDGHMVFYSSAGPEGNVMVWDTFLVPFDLLLFCISLYLHRPAPEGPKTPHLDFNPSGFRI